MISRRGVLVGASVTLLAPPAIRAQQANKVPRIGLLWGGETAFATPYVERPGARSESSATSRGRTSASIIASGSESQVRLMRGPLSSSSLRLP